MARSEQPRNVGIRREMVSGAIRTIGGQSGTAVFGVVVYVFLARLLSPEGMGVFLSTTAAVAFAGLASRLGLGPILTREIATASGRGNVAGVRSAVRKAASAVLVASFVLGLLTWIFLTRIVGHEAVVSSLGVVAVGVLGLWILSYAMEGVIADGFRGLGEIGHAVWVLRLGPLAAATCVYAAALGLGIGLDVTGAVVTMAASSIATTAIGYRMLMSRLRGDPADSGLSSEVGLTQALPVWVSNLGGYASNNLGLWAVIILGSAVEVAEYGLAARLVAPIAIPLLAVNGFMMPIIASLHSRGSRATLERTLRSTTTASSAASLVGALALAVLAPFLLRVLFGPEYVEAYPIVVILMIGAIVNVLSGSAGASLLMSGNQRVFAEITVIALVVGVVLVAVGYSQGEAVGVAVATTLVSSVRSGAMVLAVHRRIGVWTVAYLRPRDAIHAIRSLGGVSAVTARWQAPVIPPGPEDPNPGDSA